MGTVPVPGRSLLGRNPEFQPHKIPKPAAAWTETPFDDNNM